MVLGVWEKILIEKGNWLPPLHRLFFSSRGQVTIFMCPHTVQLSEGRKEGNVLFNDALNTFYLRLYGVRHMLRTILIVRKETRCRHMGYSFRLTARVLLYAPSHRQVSTYHGLCYTSRRALAGTRYSSMGQIMREETSYHYMEYSF